LLATVPEDLFDEAQDAFLEDETLLSPLAVDQRPATSSLAVSFQLLDDGRCSLLMGVLVQCRGCG
jgi:hypothetical protein